MKELCAKLRILHKTTSPYHPQCNSSVEVFNRTLRQYIQAVIQPPYLDWEIYLPALRISYNTSISKATQKTPFEILFGMEAHMPFFDYPPEFSYNLDYNERLVALDKARKEAEANNIHYKKMYEAQYNARHKVKDPSSLDSPLVVGDQILVQTFPSHKFKNNKFHPIFEGPFPVTRIKFPNVYFQRNSKIVVAHLQRVKKARVQKAFVTESSENFPEPAPQVSRVTRSVSRNNPEVFKSVAHQISDSSSDEDADRSFFSRNSQAILPVQQNQHFPTQSPSSSRSLSPEIEECDTFVNASNNSPDISQSFQSPGDNIRRNISIPELSEFSQDDLTVSEVMDTNEMSHLYNDKTMRPVDSSFDVNFPTLDQSHSHLKTPRVKSTSSSGTKLTSRIRKIFSPHSVSKRPLSSPEKPPEAKRIDSSSSSDQVRLSLAEMCLTPHKALPTVPEGRVTRSKGPVSSPPSIPFPVESKAYQKRVAEPAVHSENVPAPPPPPTQDGAAALPDDGSRPPPL